MREIHSENPIDDSSRVIRNVLITRRAFISALTRTAAIAMTPTEIFSQERRRETVSHDTTILRSAELFNTKNTNVQMHLFYDDRIDDWDGHKTFRNMLIKTYGVNISWDKKGNIAPIKTTQNKNWQIEDIGSYVRFASIGKPKKIEIYANKPSHPRDGQEEIAKEFRLQGTEPHVVVHRAHNFHIHQTLGRIPYSAKIVLPGSCESDMDIKRIKQKAPDAHIIATEGTGTMGITEPLMQMLNEEIISGRDIYWPVFWKEAGEKLGSNKNFRSYIPPYKIRQ